VLNNHTEAFADPFADPSMHLATSWGPARVPFLTSGIYPVGGAQNQDPGDLRCCCFGCNFSWFSGYTPVYPYKPSWVAALSA
jgi:hypothetical protein